MFRTGMIIAISITVIVIVALFIITEKKEKKKYKSGQVFATIAIVILFLSIFFYLLFPLAYDYDRYGNRYDHYEDVLYYTEDGSVYLMYQGEYWGDCYYYNVNDPSEVHGLDYSFFTSDGFLVFDDSGTVYIYETEYYDEYADSEGNIVYSGFQMFDWPGTFYKDRNHDWILLIGSPFEEQVFYHSMNVIFGVLALFHMIRLIWDAINHRAVKKRRKVYQFLIPSIALFISMFANIFVGILFFVVFALVMYLIVPIDEGRTQFMINHHFENADHLEYLDEMEHYFPNGWKERDLKQYAHPENIVEFRRIMLKSLLIHFGVFVMVNLISYLVLWLKN